MYTWYHVNSNKSAFQKWKPYTFYWSEFSHIIVVVNLGPHLRASLGSIKWPPIVHNLSDLSKSSPNDISWWNIEQKSYIHFAWQHYPKNYQHLNNAMLVLIKPDLSWKLTLQMNILGRRVGHIMQNCTGTDIPNSCVWNPFYSWWHFRLTEWHIFFEISSSDIIIAPSFAAVVFLCVSLVVAVLVWFFASSPTCK